MSDFPTDIEFLRRVSTAACAPEPHRTIMLEQLYAEGNLNATFSEWETWADEVSRIVLPLSVPYEPDTN